MTTVPSVTYEPTPSNFVTIPIASIPFTGGLTTPLQASVANPAVGFATIFVNSAGELSVTDALGNTYRLLDSPASFDQDMNANQILNALRVAFSGGVQVAAGATTADPSNVAVGPNAIANGIGSVSMGDGAQSQGNNCTAVGHDAHSNFLSGTAIGNATLITGNNGTAVGDSSGAFTGGAAFGANANASGQASSSIGPSSTSAGLQASALGNGSSAAGNQSVAIGNNASASVTASIAIGDGAVNAAANTCLIGDVAIANIRPNNNATCDLGTSAAEYKDVWLSNGARGPLAVASNYSTYADTTCNNTVAETDISSSGSAVGSLTLAAGQPLGMIYSLNLCMVATSAAGDTLTIRVKVNGGLLYSHVLTIPALSVALPITISARITIRNGNVHVCSLSNQNGTQAFLVSSAIVYDRTISDTWSVTAQWGANVNQLTCGQVYATSWFRG
jgi:hypothetical protein